MNFQMGRAIGFTVALLLTGSVWATCGGGGGGGSGGMGGSMGGSAPEVYVVPWKNATLSNPPPAGGMALYWFPASQTEFDLSSMRGSRTLSLLASQCVAMGVADAASDVGHKFAAGETLPVAVLTDASGAVIGKVNGEKGKLYAGNVEKLVNAELKKRESDLRDKLKTAQATAKGGDKDAAVSQYKEVLAQQCLFPRLGKDAASALKKLGVEVASVPAHAIPNYDAAVSARVLDAMNRGLAAENKLDLANADRAYTAAHQMDPADPAPLRYLGELYRHHIGDWAKARSVFNEILAMPADPLSRAVALHGLGKMTIHEGDFKKGLGLMEQSVGEFPLPLAYRNLAVYWNSEGNRVKANEYTQAALKLDPNDTYNQVFAAAYMAGDGRGKEALALANKNESLLPASYNLAAVYAQLGMRDKALALLRRHFYQYEQNDQVRSMEMMEARVDAVFASLYKDQGFVELTRNADGRLPLPAAAGSMRVN
jgi:tetratricopeptide (TPR) repeat protein